MYICQLRSVSRWDTVRGVTTPSQPLKPITLWKKVAIVSFFAGLGFAFALGLIFSGTLWYSTRSKAWNANGITAHYGQSSCYVTLQDWYRKELKKRGTDQSQNVQTPEPPPGFIPFFGKLTVVVSYDLENHTNSDYTLEPPQTSGLVPMKRLKSNGSLFDGKGLKWSIAESLNQVWTSEGKAILIPAHQTVRVVFTMDYDILGDDPAASSVADWSNKGVEKEFARHLLKDTDDFVLLDEIHRYRIDLPLQEAFK